MTQPRVTITNPFAWPQVRRGSEAVVHGLANWLAAHEVPVSILAGGSQPRRYEVEGVPVRLVRAPDLRRVQHDLDPEMTLIPGMAAALRRSRPDVVHAFMYSDALAARLARVPFIVSFGGIALRSGFKGHRLRMALLRAATAGSPTVVCPSAAVAGHLRAEYGIDAVVIPNGLNTSRFRVQAERDPGLILCAATADDRRKRVEVLVEAFDRLVTKGADVHLALAGDVRPDRADALRALLSDDARGRLELLGQLDEPALARVYARAAVTCLPSLNEAFGMVVVESLAAGTPVVAAHHGALPELVDESVGGTFAADDAEDCARVLGSVLAHADELHDACLARAAMYDWDAVAPKFLALYDAAR